MCEKEHLAHRRGMWLTHDLLRNCRLEASKRGVVSALRAEREKRTEGGKYMRVFQVDGRQVRELRANTVSPTHASSLLALLCWEAAKAKSSSAFDFAFVARFGAIVNY